MSILHHKRINILREVQEPFTPHSLPINVGVLHSRYMLCQHEEDITKSTMANFQIGPFGPTPVRDPLLNTAGWPSGLRRWFKAPVTSVARVRIPLLSLLHGTVAHHFICPSLANGTSCSQHITPDSTLIQGRMAEWSKALVLGTSHFGGVGSNPTTIRRVLWKMGHLK